VLELQLFGSYAESGASTRPEVNGAVELSPFDFLGGSFADRPILDLLTAARPAFSSRFRTLGADDPFGYRRDGA